ncbi:MAG: hypothetical protein V3T83_17465 [Acidobacteriota bacterium]
MRRIGWGIGVLAVVLLIALLGLLSLRRPNSNSVSRGWELAGRLGCFSCHAPEGTGGVANPGSEEEEIPAWDGGLLMMYVESQEEIAEWILYGQPERLKDDHQDSESGHAGLIRMPAFQARISEPELNDLVALVQAIGAYGQPAMPPAVREGLEAARRLGCFGCHRVGGRVGTPNPGSFKGYIPPWRGEDFEDLVRSDAELRAWILDGRIERLESNPLARFFTGRQIIQMPAYRELLSGQELESLLAYIRWVRLSGTDQGSR